MHWSLSVGLKPGPVEIGAMNYCESIIAKAGSLLLWGLASCGGPNDAPTVGFGVNLAGAEFGSHGKDFSNENSGRHGQEYVFPQKETMAYFASRGLRIIRLPLSWERLQPILGAGLDQSYTGRVLEQLDTAAFHGCKVVLDLHNYGRYRLNDRGRAHEFVLGEPQGGGQGLRAEHLSDLWLRLGAHVREHPALMAYGLMNEPHDMGRANWHDTSNQVVRALRSAQDRTWIWVAGDGWSKAHEWLKHNPKTPWIKDPLERTAYEAHLYFDRDGSGRYQSTFDQELRTDPNILLRGSERLEVFAQWCERGGVQGVIGEFGVPWFERRWLPVLDGFLDRAKEKQMTAVAWAGGDWWGEYPLSLQPRNDQDVGPLIAILRAAPRLSLSGSLRVDVPAVQSAGAAISLRQ